MELQKLGLLKILKKEDALKERLTLLEVQQVALLH